MERSWHQVASSMSTQRPTSLPSSLRSSYDFLPGSAWTDVTVKVVSTGDIRPVTKRNGTVADKDKCELLVGDSTGTCRFVLSG